MTSVGDILLSELTQAKTYIERLFHALGDLSGAHNHPKIKVALRELTIELEDNIRENFISSVFSEQSLLHQDNLKCAKHNFKILTNFVESFILLSGNKKELTLRASAFINLIYIHAKEIHTLTQNLAALDVQPPRVGILKAIAEKVEPVATLKDATKEEFEVKKVGPFTLIEGGRVDEFDIDEEEEEQEQPPLLFQIDIEELLKVTEDKKTSLLGLSSKRDEKYDEFLNQGHQLAFEKKHPEALEAFEKAKSYKKTAEILTLISWINSILGDTELAKSQCIEAIGLDPDYGPPYNDLGSLLLNEGQVEEAIKWFELAKNAAKYNNREYPYINSGRAHMMLHQYEKAINEFHKALSLCPENTDLKDTIEKLSKSLNKDSDPFEFKVNFNESNENHEDGPSLD